MKTLFMIYLYMVYNVCGYGQHLHSTVYHSTTFDFYAKIYKLNDSLNDVYIFSPTNDSLGKAYFHSSNNYHLMDLIFVKNNKCMSFISSDFTDITISTFFDINDSTKEFIQQMGANIFRIGELIFRKDYSGRYADIDTLPRYKFFPKIRHGRYFYSLKNSLPMPDVRLFSEPTSFSRSRVFNLKNNFTDEFTISSSRVYFSGKDIFYLIGFGDEVEDERFKQIYYIRESDAHRFFNSEH